MASFASVITPLTVTGLSASNVADYKLKMQQATGQAWQAYHVKMQTDGLGNLILSRHPILSTALYKMQVNDVYTLLVGKEDSDLFGGMSVNPATLRNIASVTGGEFFRASDYAAFDRGFQTVRTKLDTTKRTVSERVPDKQLFVPFATIAALLLALELLLSHTRLRRLP